MTTSKEETAMQDGRHEKLRTVGLLLVLAAVLSLSSCESRDPTGPPEMHSLAFEYGFTPDMLYWALDVAASTGTVSSVVVERHGTVVAEGHFLDVPPWGVHETWSVTAVLTSLLVGIALDQGYLESLDQCLGDFLDPWSEHLTEAQAQITLRQLLTMTSGVARPRGTPEEFFTWMEEENHVAWVLDLPLRALPGERYNFDSGAAHLLTAVLNQATGRDLEALAQEAVWDPMGIPFAQWLSDPQGVNYGGFGLLMRSRDIVKLGRLALSEGSWQGRQLVSADWMRESISPKVHPYSDYPEWGFGYLWKITQCRGYPCLYASGYGGQILVAFPTLDMVIAVTSIYSEDSREATVSSDTAWSIVLDYILPSVR
jgi:CubicO group peptidase (beta-lactamase class C family)